MKQVLLLCLILLFVISVALPSWISPRPVQETGLITLEDSPLAMGALNLEAINAFGLDSPWLKGVVLSAVGDANALGYGGRTRAQIENELGGPLSRYGNTTIASLNTATRSYYAIGEEILLVYYDNKNQQRALFTLQFNAETATATRFMTSLAQDNEGIAKMTQDTLALLNGVRGHYQRKALKNHPQLATLALKHSQDMLKQNYFSHTNSAGVGPKARIQAAKIPFKGFGEALTAGTLTPVEAITAWLNSDGHRPIVLGDYTHSGIGIATGNTGYGIYFTLKVIKQ